MANQVSVKDAPLKVHDIPLNGKLITSRSPALIGENDFSSLVNFVYTSDGIKTMNGHIKYMGSSDDIRTYLQTKINGRPVRAYQLYYKTGISAVSLWITDINSGSYQYRELANRYNENYSFNAGELALYTTDLKSPPAFYLECIESGTTGSTAPDFDSYDYNEKITDGTVVWIKRKGGLEGHLTTAPDNTIVFTNGVHNFIYGGINHRAGVVMNLVTDPIDITEQVVNERTEDKFCSVLKKIAADKIQLDIGSPLKLRGFNLKFKKHNSVSSTVSISRYDLSGWVSASSVTDNTNGFAQDGAITFTMTGDNLVYEEASDIPVYLYNRHLYYYRITLSPTVVWTADSGSLPDDISLYHISCRTIIQKIPNLWDGTVYTPAVFWTYDGTRYCDHTLPVSRRDTSIVWFSNTSYTPSPETSVYLIYVSTIYIGSITRCTGFRFTFSISFSTRTWVNSNPVTMTVYYWNGSAWTSVSNLVDGTLIGSASFAQDGVVYFTAPEEEEEKKTTIATDIPLYYYKISFSGGLGDYTHLDYIETIPVSPELGSYRCCAIWNNRLVLASNTQSPNNANEVIFSAPSSPYIWSGEQSIQLNIGDTQEITKLTTLFSRYGTDITEALLVFKEQSLYYISGSTKDDIKSYTVSNSLGTSSPYSVATCDLGIRIAEGINRAIVIFANNTGVYLFDNSSIISISDDISNVFSSDAYQEACRYVSGFYDPINSRYHIVWWYDGNPYEYIFDLIYKKWSSANRGSQGLFGGGIAYDGDKPFVIGMTSDCVLKLNVSSLMDNKSFTATFTTGVKPLSPTLFGVNNIRRAKLTVDSGISSSDYSIELKINSIDEDNIASTSTFSSLPVSSTSQISFPVCQTNITGVLFYYTVSITLNSTSSNTVQPVNISVLFKPAGIDMT